MRTLMKLLSLIFDIKSASKGVKPYAKRQVRKRIMRSVRRKLR